MASELKVTLSARLKNGLLAEIFEPGQISIDQAVALSHAPTVIVGTSEEDLAVGDIATLGHLFLLNLDATNYVKFGPKSGSDMVPYGRIAAGKLAYIPLEPGITHRWIAVGGSVKVKVLLLNA